MFVSDATSLEFPQCFVCGSENATGLHVRFVRDGARGCRAEYVAGADHVGWPNLMHVGLIFTLMDEAVAWALCFEGLRGVTGKADVRFRQPVRVGDRLTVTGSVVEHSRRVVKTRAEIRLADAPARVVADMDATMVLTDVEQWRPAGERRGATGPVRGEGPSGPPDHTG
jgi:acyl-coenzyme A thioesterase PaaI-like protein